MVGPLDLVEMHDDLLYPAINVMLRTDAVLYGCCLTGASCDAASHPWLPWYVGLPHDALRAHRADCVQERNGLNKAS